MFSFLPFKLLQSALTTFGHADAIWDNVHQIRSSTTLSVWRVRENNWDPLLAPIHVGGTVDICIYLLRKQHQTCIFETNDANVEDSLSHVELTHFNTVSQLNLNILFKYNIQI